MKKTTVGAFIGRMQGYSLAHHEHVMKCITDYDLAVIILGSSFRSRNPDNPFTFEERRAMILAAVPEALHSKLKFVGMRDYHDDNKWLEVVYRKVDALLKAHDDTAEYDIHLISYVKDESGYYQQMFKNWKLVSHRPLVCVDKENPINATDLRRLFFSELSEKAIRPLLETKMPKDAVDYLFAWKQLNRTAFELIKDQTQYGIEYNQGHKYPLKATTGDAIFILNDEEVLIGVRGKLVGKGLYCIPGGHNNPDEDHISTAIRELREETLLSFSPAMLRELITSVEWVDRPKRSWLCRIITCVVTFHYQGIKPHVKAHDDLADLVWMTREDILANESKFHDDHFNLLCKALKITPKD